MSNEQRACELHLSNDAGFYSVCLEAARDAARDAASEEGATLASVREAARDAVAREVEGVLEDIEAQIEAALEGLTGLARDLAGGFDASHVDAEEIAESVVDLDWIARAAWEGREEDGDGDGETGGDFFDLVGDLWVSADNEGDALAALARIYADHNGGEAAPWGTWGEFETWAREGLNPRGWREAEGLRPVEACEYRLHAGGDGGEGSPVWGIFARGEGGEVI